MRLAFAAAMVLLVWHAAPSLSADPQTEQNGLLPPLPSALGVSGFQPASLPAASFPTAPSLVRNTNNSHSFGNSYLASYQPTERLWLRGDLMLWWTSGNRLPPLVTSSPPQTIRSEAGVLDLGHPLAPLTNSTSILLGDEKVDDDFRLGGRVTAGFWCDEGQCNGLEATWFSLQDESGTDFSAGSDDYEILARPFFNVGTLNEDSQLVAFPDVVEGNVGVMTSSEIQSGAILLRRILRGDANSRTDFMFGYRYLQFDEKLSLEEDLISTDPGGFIAQGTTFDIYERFETQNRFHGVDVGVAYQLMRARLKLDASAKIGFGGLHREVEIDGSTTIASPGGVPVTVVGGLLAQPTNIGNQDETKVAILPEIDLSIQCSLTSDLTCSIGYSLIVLPSVFRTGDQIDRAIDLTGLPTASGQVGPGAGHPIMPLDSSVLWLQGLSFGIELRR